MDISLASQLSNLANSDIVTIYISIWQALQRPGETELGLIREVNAPHPKGRGFYRFFEEIAFPISEYL